VDKSRGQIASEPDINDVVFWEVGQKTKECLRVRNFRVQRKDSTPDPFGIKNVPTGTFPQFLDFVGDVK
jgi:hypothetical protein